MRKRKRDWPIRVLKYRAYPSNVPQAVWDTSKLQRNLWNNLVALWRGAADQAAVLPDQKKTIWKTFDEWSLAAVKVSGLDWVNGPDVLDRFRAASRARKIPRFHGGLDRISLSHRFTGGGLPLDKIVDNPRTTRIGLVSSNEWEPIRTTHSPDRKHWRGRMSMADSTIEFSLALHRPLPADAILKRAAWLGERAGKHWFWHLALTIEEPPSTPAVADESDPVAGIDFGWRLFADGIKYDYVRIGMLTDSEGHAVELLLPLNLRPHRIKEVRGLGSIGAWQERASGLIEDGKTLLQLVALPPALSAIAVNPKLGRRGLGRILREGALPAATGAALGDLLNAHDWLYQKISHLRFRLIERRRWYYQNLANWLCERYGKIAIEGDMSIADLHRRTDNPALQNAAQYRNYAAIGEFRAILQRTAPKFGCVVDGAARNTSSVCWQCGGAIDGGAGMMIGCANGHESDQDKNAARNLLSQIDGSFGQPHVLRKTQPAAGWKLLEIPERISAVAIEVPA